MQVRHGGARRKKGRIRKGRKKSRTRELGAGKKITDVLSVRECEKSGGITEPKGNRSPNQMRTRPLGGESQALMQGLSMR